MTGAQQGGARRTLLKGRKSWSEKEAPSEGWSLVTPLLSPLSKDGVVRVLVVEDQVDLADYIADGLRDQGMAADVAYNGSSGLEKAMLYRYEVVVLDRDLPKVHGDAVCTALTQSASEARILMLTAARAVGDRVEGLNLGADDYLSKPFDFVELVARVRALVRRTGPTPSPLLVRADLVLDRARRRASRGGLPLSLTRKEMSLLELLLVADGAVMSAEEILERVWDEHADQFSNVVSVTISRLRRKLGEPDPIQTVQGFGFRVP
jgi:DNA-binding response OmpR family regulator